MPACILSNNVFHKFPDDQISGSEMRLKSMNLENQLKWSSSRLLEYFEDLTCLVFAHKNVSKQWRQSVVNYCKKKPWKDKLLEKCYFCQKPGLGPFSLRYLRVEVLFSTTNYRLILKNLNWTGESESSNYILYLFDKNFLTFKSFQSWKTQNCSKAFKPDPTYKIV